MARTWRWWVVALVVAVAVAVGSDWVGAPPAPAGKQLAVPPITSRAVNASERALLDDLGRESGARIALGRAGWEDLLATLSRATVDLRDRVRVATRPTVSPRMGRAVQQGIGGGTGTFSGVIDSLLRSGSDIIGTLEPDQGGSTFETDGGERTEIDSETGERLTHTTTVTMQTSVSVYDSLVEAFAGLEAVRTVTGPAGDVRAVVTTRVSGTFRLTICPSGDGGVSLDGEVTAEVSSNGSAARTKLRLDAKGVVDDDAYLEAFEWSADAEGDRGSASTRGRADATASGRIDFAGATASLVDQDGADGGDLARFQSQLAEAGMNLVASAAQKRWRGGACLEIRTTEASRTVPANTTVPVRATVWHRRDQVEIPARLDPSFSGTRSLVPGRGTHDTPLDLTYRAGAKTDDEGTVTLRSTSRRGVAEKSLTFTVGSSGWRVESVVPNPFARWEGEVCDLTAPWTARFRLADFEPIELRSMPTGDGGSGTLELSWRYAPEPGLVGTAESSGSYRVTVLPAAGRDAAGVQTVDLTTGPWRISAQVLDLFDTDLISGGDSGFNLVPDPKACTGR